MFEDKVLVCKDCGKEFVFTAGEQEFYESKGFQNEPGRCKECRSARKSYYNRGGSEGREMFDVICAQCGKEAKVPFKPRLEKPVYCSECFSNL
jgi:CxxC-x17-CxxC domain-containing protein